ncbi:MAG: hypothetical protein WC959_07570 [Kiritimatiellales bacterium]
MYSARVLQNCERWLLEPRVVMKWRCRGDQKADGTVYREYTEFHCVFLNGIKLFEHTDRAACDQFVADFKAGRSYSEPLTHGAGI